MPTIKMKQTTPGSDDGISRHVYEAGKEYSVGQTLAMIFVDQMKVANYPVDKPAEEKAISKAPENAAMKAAPENKAEGSETVEKKPEKESGWEPPKKKDKSKGKVMRVYQLADELSINSKDVLIAVENLGIYARNAASGLSKDEIEKVRAALKK